MNTNKRFVGGLAVAAGTALYVLYIFLCGGSRLHWNKGDTQMYRFSFRTRVKNIQFATRRITDYMQDIKGTLNFRVLDTVGERVECAVQLSDVKVTESGKANKDLEKLYSGCFLVTFTRDGEMTGHHFDNSVAREDEKAIMNMLKFFQVVMPGNSQDSWETEEQDALGHFAAGYIITGNGVTRQKKRYITMNNDAYTQYRGNINLRISGSKTGFKYNDRTSWLLSLRGKEKIVTRVQARENKEPAMTVISEVRGQLELVPFAPDRQLVIWNRDCSIDYLKKQFVYGEKNPFSYWERRKKGEQLRVLAGRDLKDLADRFAHCENIADVHAAVVLLRDYLLLNPNQAREIPALLKQPRISKGTSAAIINALTMCGNHEAQQALCRIMEDRGQKHSTRVSAAGSLSDLEDPRVEIVHSVLELSRERTVTGDIEFSNTALLAAGNLACKDIDPVIKNSVRDHLASRLDQPRDDYETALLVSAIGNSEDETQASLVADYLDHPNPLVRSSAAYAAEHVKNTGLLHAAGIQLLTEQNAQVRQTIIETLSKNKADETTLTAVRQRVVNETDSKNRLAMYRYLYKQENDRQQVEVLFKERLAKETARENRAYLVKALFSLR